MKRLCKLLCLGFSAAVLSLSSVCSAQDEKIQSFHIRIETPAHTGMPLWVEAIDLPPSFSSHYPYSSVKSFGNNKLELRKDSQEIATTIPRLVGENISSCRTPVVDKLPVHVSFPLAAPGTYSVRWSVMSKNNPSQLLCQSDWQTFELKQSSEEELERWLDKELSSPPRDRDKLLSQYIPNLLATAPDKRVLRRILALDYDSDFAVAQCALNSIEHDRFFNPEDVRSELLDTCQRNGLCGRGLDFYIANDSIFQGVRDEFEKIAIQDLNSKDDARLTAALIFLSDLSDLSRNSKDSRVDLSVLNQEAAKVVLDRAPQYMQRPEARKALARHLGCIGTAQARQLLLQMLGIPIEQNDRYHHENYKFTVLSGLSEIGDRKDFPMLADWLVENMNATMACRVVDWAAFSLERRFPEQAKPYLEKVIKESSSPHNRYTCALQLLDQDSEVGRQYLIGEVANGTDCGKSVEALVKNNCAKDLSPVATRDDVIAVLKAGKKIDPSFVVGAN